MVLLQRARHRGQGLRAQDRECRRRDLPGRLAGLPRRRLGGWRDLAPRRDRVRRQGADDPPQARRRRGALRLLRALPDGAPRSAHRARRPLVSRYPAAARPNPRRCAARPAGDRRRAGADLLDHRAPASRRDHGRMVDGGLSGATAGPRRSARPRAAREGAVLRGAQHEPRRQPPRASQDQRGGRQP